MKVTIKRQSTTIKLTKHVIHLMQRQIDKGDGIIVRHKGKEYGGIGVIGNYVETHEGHFFHYTELTIRKETRMYLPLSAHWFDGSVNFG